jgi:AraC-like DNA-binding protein
MRTLNLPFSLKLFFAFLSVVAVPAIGISLLSHGLVVRLYKNELGNSYLEKIKLAEAVLNTWETETTQTALAISLAGNRLVGELFQEAGQENNNYPRVNRLSSLSSMMEELVMVNNLFSSIMLLYRNSDYLITQSYVVRKNSDADFQRYASYIKKKQYWISGDSEENPLLYVFPVIPFVEDPEGILVFTVKEAELNKLINGDKEGGSGKIFIMDRQGTRISDADPSAIGKSFLSVPAIAAICSNGADEGFFASRAGGTECLVIYRQSAKNGWYFCSFVPMTEINDRISVISVITAALTIGLLILAILLSYPLAKKLNQSVTRLESRLEDYDLLQLFSRKAPEGGKQNLIRLFPRPQVCCAILSPDQSGLRHGETGEGQQNGRGTGAVLPEEDKKAVMKTALEALSVRYSCKALFPEQNDMVLVMNAASFDPAFTAAALRKAQKQSLEKFGLSVSIGVGTSVVPEEISASYHAARRALLNRLSSGYGCLEFFSESPAAAGYFYPVDQANSIFNNLQLCLYDKTAEAVDSFFAELKQRNNLPVNNIILALYQLMGAVIHYIIETHIDIRKTFEDDIDFYHRMSEFKILDEIQAYFKDIFRQIIDFELNVRADSRKSISRILNYIHTNLDKTFDINAMSDSLGLSYSYVRRVFSQEMGENILNYVYKMKIDAAKKMLNKTGLSAEEIARNLGFYNRQSFYRFFKKFEGITPSEFRQIS